MLKLNIYAKNLANLNPEDNCFFIAKFKDNKLRDAVRISESDYWFHIENIPQTVFGYKLSDRGFPKYTPGKLWACYFEKDENAELFDAYP